MIRRAVRTAGRLVGPVSLGCLGLSFVLAFAFMFVFPPAALALVFVGIFGAVALRLLALAIGALGRRLDRGEAASGGGDAEDIADEVGEGP